MTLNTNSRICTIGEIIDLIAPEAKGPARSGIESRLARWTKDGIFVVAKTQIGTGRARQYTTAEAVLVAIGHQLQMQGLRNDAIENITVALRSDIEHKPGANAVDLAVDFIRGGEPKSEPSRIAQDGDCLAAFHRVGSTDIWHPVRPKRVGTAISAADIAQHESAITLNLRLVLKPLRPLLT